MPRPHLPPTQRRLTDAELELMNVLWTTGPGTVRNVLAALPADRSRAYTTVSTILRILQDKGVVGVTRQGRSHVYVPLVTRESYQNAHVQQVVQDVFGGDALGLVRQLVQAEDLDADQIDALRRLVDELAP